MLYVKYQKNLTTYNIAKFIINHIIWLLDESFFFTQQRFDINLDDSVVDVAADDVFGEDGVADWKKGDGLVNADETTGKSGDEDDGGLCQRSLVEVLER